ncbi:MAG: DUF6516 family protein [Mariprofundaceae bacterium]|nr:DUF6516 family protein [Mariprofundaceae bacterium]
MKDDTGLETLLSLDSEIFPMDNGYWTKFEVKKVGRSDRVPHGVRYSLTLHDRSNRRVFGIDNAHGFKPKRKRFGAAKTTWDHQHVKEKVLPYEFESPESLLEDFWNEVERIIGGK